MSLGKKSITKDISAKTQIPNDISNHFLKLFIEIILVNSKSKLVKISNFGSFLMKTTPERIGRNPKTKQEFIISKRSKLFFKPSNKLKKILN